MSSETSTVTCSNKETGSIAWTYTIKVNKQAPIETTITTTPGDATVFLTSDVNGDRILPGDKGIYTLDSGSSYTVVVTRYGYVGQKKTCAGGEANQHEHIQLAKTHKTTRTMNTSAWWMCAPPSPLRTPFWCWPTSWARATAAALWAAPSSWAATSIPIPVPPS